MQIIVLVTSLQRQSIKFLQPSKGPKYTNEKMQQSFTYSLTLTYNIFIRTLLESFFFNEIFAKLFLLVLVGCQNIIAGFF